MRFVLLIGVLALSQAAPSARVSGRVTTEPNGAPLAGVLITLYREASGMNPQAISSPPRTVTVTSDKEGRYEIANMSPGRYQVSPSFRGYVFLLDGPGSMPNVAKTIEIKPGQTSVAVDFLMHRTSSITIQVTDDIGQPIGDVRVSLERGGDGSLQSVGSIERRIATVAPPSTFARSGITDETGEVRLLEVPPGEYFVAANPNLGSSTIRIGSNQSPLTLARTYYPGVRLRADATPLLVGSGQDAAIGIRLQSVRVWRIRGTVTTSTGELVPSAVVTLFPVTATGPASSELLPAGSRQASARDGRFELTDVVPGEYVVAAAADSMRRFDSGNTPVSVVDRDVDEVRIVTAQEPGRRIGLLQFSVTAPPATFVAGGTAPTLRPGQAGFQGRVLAAGSDTPLSRAVVSLGTPRTSFSDAAKVMTDEDGRYEFAGLPAGQYLIRAKKSGFATATYGASDPPREPEAIVIAADDHRRDVDVRLQAGSAILVSVIRSDGTAVPSARVQISRKGEAQERISVADSAAGTDDRGRMRVGGLPPGTYYVGAIDDSGSQFSMMVYFPGTLLFTEAQPLVLSGAQEAHVTITLSK